MEMRESMQRTTQALSQARPLNTSKAYDPKIAEFRAWCDYKFHYQPLEQRYIVTGEKAHYFLDDAVRFFFFFICESDRTLLIGQRKNIST